MPLGYIPGSHPGLYSTLSHRLFGSRKFTRTIEYRILCRWLPRRRCNVLDVGSGNGELAAQLVLKGHRVTGMDLDLSALRLGRSYGLPDLVLAVGDATRLPFADGVFDLIVCNSALEHFPSGEHAVREMARVLGGNGTLLLTTDTFPDQVSGWLKAVPESWRTAGLRGSGDLTSRVRSYHQSACNVVSYYRAETLIPLLEGSGFQVLDWHYYLNGWVTKGIFELHLLLKWLDFYNRASRRLFPLFYPFTFPRESPALGYGLALRAVRSPA